MEAQRRESLSFLVAAKPGFKVRRPRWRIAILGKQLAYFCLFRFFIMAGLVNNLTKLVITFTCTQAIYRQQVLAGAGCLPFLQAD